MKSFIGVMIFIFVLSFSVFSEVKYGASIVEITGNVEVSFIGEVWVPAQIGTKLFENDMIRTGEKSSVRLKLDDNTFTTIGANSKVRMEELKSEIKEVKKGTEKEIKNISLKILNGEALSKVKKLEKESIFQIKTPVAVCGVRGTSFNVEHQDKTKVQVVEGAVEVYNLDYPENIIKLFEKQESIIEEKKIPTPPVNMNEEDLNKLTEKIESIKESAIELEPEIIDQKFTLLRESDSGKEYEYLVKVKNIDVKTAKVYLILYKETGEEYKTIEMKTTSSKDEDVSTIKIYKVNVLFSETGKYLHRYKIVAE